MGIPNVHDGDDDVCGWYYSMYDIVIIPIEIIGEILTFITTQNSICPSIEIGHATHLWKAEIVLSLHFMIIKSSASSI